MKNLILIGLICLTLIGGACSKGFQGGYRGDAAIETFKQNNTADTAKASPSDIFALVTNEDGGTIEFSETDAIKNCKLKVDSLTVNPELPAGQTCQVNVGGEIIPFTVDDIYFTHWTKNETTLFINVTGKTSDAYKDGRVHVSIVFKGKPYDKK